jgi:antitoxin MazE
MSEVIKTRVIRIGNSRGVRIPKSLLDQSRLGDEVELEAQRDRIIIRSAKRPRRGWDEAFRSMAERGDDRMIDGDLVRQTRWDETRWQW